MLVGMGPRKAEELTTRPALHERALRKHSQTGQVTETASALKPVGGSSGSTSAPLAGDPQPGFCSAQTEKQHAACKRRGKSGRTNRIPVSGCL